MSAIAVLQRQTSPERVLQARKEITVFFAFLIPLTVIAYAAMFLLHVPDYFLIWVPAISSILARLLLRMRFDDISLRFGGRKTWYAILFVFAFTLIVSGVSYGLAWGLGLAHFVVPHNIIPRPLPNPSDPTLRFFWTLFLTATLVTLVFSVALTPGEEIGWRGFMLTRFIEAKIPYPLLLQGLVWGLWHVPFIVSGSYKPGGNPFPILDVLIFMVSATCFSYYVAWLRLRTGSIWPCIIAHGAWNAISQVAFDPDATGPFARFWVGESGVLVALIAVIMVVAIYRIWPLKTLWLKPGEPLGEADMIARP